MAPENVQEAELRALPPKRYFPEDEILLGGLGQ
jgi:hypothetical protein